MILNHCEYMDGYNAWNKVFASLTTQEYKQAFLGNFKITNSTKLRDFQYRLLWKRIPSNKELHRWNIKKHPECNFCSEVDSIVHTLIECPHVRKLWQDFFKLIPESERTLICDDPKNIILNNIYPKYGNIVNTKVLICKQLIYRYKCKNERIQI